MAELSLSNTSLPLRLKPPSFNSQPGRMAEQDTLPIDLAYFPYFPEGDIIISLSPSDSRPMSLHSEVLVKYLGYFRERLKGHVYLKGLAKSSRIAGLKGPGTMRYELVCRKEYDWEECESEMGMLELKQVTTPIPLRYRPTESIRRAYALLFALIYEDHVDTETSILRNFPSLDDTLQFHHLYKLWKAYSCNLHASSYFGCATDKRVQQEMYRSHTAVTLVSTPWHVLPLACLFRSPKFYEVAFNAGVWHQFQYRYGTSAHTKSVTSYLTAQGLLCEYTRDAIKDAVRTLVLTLESVADEIEALDIKRRSDTAQAMWKYYIRQHISQTGHCEADLEFYRELWHGNITNSAVIAFYKKDFPNETDRYHDKGYFTVRTEVRDILSAIMSCVKPLFVDDHGKEYGTSSYDPFTDLCAATRWKLKYPWEVEGDRPLHAEKRSVEVKNEKDSSIKSGDGFAIKREGSEMRDSMDEGDAFESETGMETGTRKRSKDSEEGHWAWGKG